LNYRSIKQSNDKKTNIVLAIYASIFLFIGLLGDILLTFLNPGFFKPDSNLIDAFQIISSKILHGEYIPIFTLSMIAISFVIIFITMKWGNKILLSGNENILLNGKDNLTRSETQVLNIVEELRISSRIRFMPKVYIIEADYMNAFASGWDEENSLVAITRGLLDKLSRGEIAAVLAHEIAHIKNKDVKLTLVVGILTNLMVYAIDFIFYSILSKSNSDNKLIGQIKTVTFILKILLPILTIFLQLYVSRKREFMADAGSVEFTGDSDSMISALKKISSDYDTSDYDLSSENSTRNYANFFNPSSLFSTHPSIEKRIENLS
jgi:heat shock protein HtpX